MRKIIVQEMLSVDGFFCGPNGEIDWHNVDAEFNDYAITVLDSVDTLIFGRVTFELMASYWPTPSALKDDPRVAERMNRLHKFYYSTTPEKLTWNNSESRSKIDPAELLKMKQAPGKDMIIYGSGMIVAALTELGLVDEYRFLVAPVILGNGRTLFTTVKERQKLKLTRTQVFKSGNVLSCYEPLK